MLACSIGPSRRRLLGAALALVLAGTARATGSDETPRTVAILDFELVDDQHEQAPASAEYRRLAAIREQLARELVERGLYRVVDIGPAADLIARYRATVPLHRCNGCEIDVARSLHADRVLVGWVQKVSNLILNINFRIEDTATGDVLLRKSVDLRGNTDETWRRGVSYLVTSMVEKGQGNR